MSDLVVVDKLVVRPDGSIGLGGRYEVSAEDAVAGIKEGIYRAEGCKRGEVPAAIKLKSSKGKTIAPAEDADAAAEVE